MYHSFCLFISLDRLDIDQGDYKHLDNCKDVSLLASAFKLFLRELPTPLITREMRKFLFSSHVDFERNSDAKELAESAKKSMELLDPLPRRVLKYVLQHMKRISDVKGLISKFMCHLYIYIYIYIYILRLKLIHQLKLNF